MRSDAHEILRGLAPLLVLCACSGDEAWEAALDVTVTWASDTMDDSETPSTTGATKPSGTTTTSGTTEGPSGSETAVSESTTPGSTSATAATTTVEPAECGDGEVGGDEECDDGNNDNTDDCLNSCMFPYCGDGILGDDEECDDGNPENDDGCNAVCARDRVVFVTSEAFTPNLGTVSGANQACRGLAIIAGLDNAEGFRAWISGLDHSPATRFFKSNGRYVLLTGDPIANDWADLTDGELIAPINVDENLALVDTVPIWTNTTIAGEIHPDSHDCANWLDTDFEITGRYGVNSLSDEGWTEFPDDPAPCANEAYLYCFEQE